MLVSLGCFGKLSNRASTLVKPPVHASSATVLGFGVVEVAHEVFDEGVIVKFGHEAGEAGVAVVDVGAGFEHADEGGGGEGEGAEEDDFDVEGLGFDGFVDEGADGEADHGDFVVEAVGHGWEEAAEGGVAVGEAAGVEAVGEGVEVAGLGTAFAAFGGGLVGQGTPPGGRKGKSQREDYRTYEL